MKAFSYITIEIFGIVGFVCGCVALYACLTGEKYNRVAVSSFVFWFYGCAITALLVHLNITTVEPLLPVFLIFIFWLTVGTIISFRKGSIEQRERIKAGLKQSLFYLLAAVLIIIISTIILFFTEY